MTRHAKRLDRLERLERLRDIARMQALRDSAEAIGTLGRARAIAERSEQLGIAGREAADGNALSDNFRFSAALGELREDARRSVETASAAVDTAQAALTRRSHERDLVRDKREEAQRLARRVNHTASPGLARNVNSKATGTTAANRPQGNAS